MATLNEVRWWNTAALEQLEVSLTGRLRTLNEVNTVVTDVGKLPGWTGEAATAAHQSFASATDLFTDFAAPLGAVRTMSVQARASISALKVQLGQLEQDCRKQGVFLHDDGKVVGGSSPVSSDALATLGARATAIIKKAEDIQNDMASVLKQAVEGKIKDGGATTITAAADTGSRSGNLTAPAPPTGSPRLARAWWDSLTPAEQAQVLRDHPEWPGNTDGVPAEARDKGNRTVLAGLTQTAQAQLDANTAKHADWAQGRNIPPIGGDDKTFREYLAWRGERGKIEKDLRGYQAVDSALRQPGAPKFLLHVDDQGHAAVSLNNPDKASNVVTFVPGTTAKTEDLPGSMTRMQDIIKATQEAKPGASVAVVSWYDYSAPQGLPNAASPHYAEDAAPRLNSFQDGLRAAHDGPRSTNTVIGHSYGSTVTGYAASHGRTLDADNLIFAGSPGVGVQHATDLRLTGLDPKLNGGHIYATAIDSDIVPRTEGHGPSPAGRPTSFIPMPGTPVPWLPVPGDIKSSFGATEFGSNPSWRPPLNPVAAHSAYWDWGNPGLRTQGRIIAGLGK